MQKNTPLETMYMEYANTVKHFLDVYKRQEELSARIRSIGRRNHVYDDNNRFSYADITYDSRLRELTGPKGGIQLSGREGRLLEIFLQNPSCLLYTSRCV